MTSSPNLSLGSELRKFNLGLSAGQQVKSFLAEHADAAKQFMRKHQVQEKRWQQNMNEKQMLKFNIERYIKGWQFAQTLPDPYTALKFIDYFFEIGGMSLNTSGFLNTIELLGDEEQVKFWRNQIIKARVFGGYVQTQLGHGSNVQGLETQAYYDEKTQSFTINSPTVKSVKFWPGVLGLFSTHALMQAKTFVKGQSIGNQTFVIEIRNDKLRQIENVQAGDLGPKLGFMRVDNGYLQLNNIKVPRRAMLMRYVQLQPDGEVIGLENKQSIKYGYGSMLYLRVKLVYGFAFGYILTPTRELALIYKKMGVLEEQSRRKELITYFCIGQGILLSNLNVQKIYNKFISELNEKNYKSADKLLISCHIISSTFKTLAGWKGLEISRDICSKNVFSLLKASNIPKIFTDAIPTVTYEGDNSVLLQQTAKFILMKQKVNKVQKPAACVRDDDMEGILKILQYVSSMEIARIQNIMKQQMQNGVTINTLWNQNNQKDIIDVSKLWGYMNLAYYFLESLKNITEFKKLFEKVGKVYIKNLLEDTPQFFLYGFSVEETEPWKLISDQEFEALNSFSRLTMDKREEQNIYSRNGSWIKSKL